MVTVELALGLPALVAVAVMLAWLVSLGVAQGSLAEAAREGARAAARGESSATVRATVAHLAPGAVVAVRSTGERVVVTAVLRREPPLRLLRPFSRQLRASATSWREHL